MIRGSFACFDVSASSARRNVAKDSAALVFDDVSSMAYSNYNIPFNGSLKSSYLSSIVAVSDRVEGLLAPGTVVARG